MISRNQIIKNLSENEKIMITVTTLLEAGGEIKNGWKAVINVILNRMVEEKCNAEKILAA